MRTPTRRRVRRLRDNPEGQMTILEHLTELRDRLLRCVLALFITTTVAFVVVYEPVLRFVTKSYCTIPAKYRVATAGGGCRLLAQRQQPAAASGGGDAVLGGDGAVGLGDKAQDRLVHHHERHGGGDEQGQHAAQQPVPELGEVLQDGHLAFGVVPKATHAASCRGTHELGRNAEEGLAGGGALLGIGRLGGLGLVVVVHGVVDAVLELLDAQPKVARNAGEPACAEQQRDHHDHDQVLLVEHRWCPSSSRSCTVTVRVVQAYCAGRSSSMALWRMADHHAGLPVEASGWVRATPSLTPMTTSARSAWPAAAVRAIGDARLRGRQPRPAVSSNEHVAGRFPLPRLLAERYELSAPLASGQVTSVWRGHDRILGRDVIVKVMHPELAADQGVRARFHQEAVNAARLTHPNIVAVYDTGQQHDVTYLVMELVEGPTLGEALRAGGALPPAEAARVALQVAQALGYAHQAGVVHRNLTPNNILLGSDSAVKVGDFSIAAAAQADDDPGRTGELAGPPAYLAPELIDGQEPDGCADLYGLGACLYEMLTGRPPQPALAIPGHHTGPLHAPRAVRADVPRELDTVVQRSMAADPAGRYPNAQAMAAAVARPAGQADRGPGSHIPAELGPAEPADAPAESGFLHHEGRWLD